MRMMGVSATTAD